MTTSAPTRTETTDLELLLRELKEHALQIGDVVLSNGERSTYYVDVKAAIMREAALRATGRLVANKAHELGATAVGGLTMGADPVAIGAVSANEGPELFAFLVRKEPKSHGLHRSMEGPRLASDAKCLIVDDVVTTGKSTIKAIENVQAEGFEIVGCLAVVDRLNGGRQRIEEASDAPFFALTTIDDIHPDRPDRD